MQKKCWCGIWHTEKSFGWTVVRNPRSTLNGRPTTGTQPYYVYKRDVPADEKHHAADLTPHTYPSKAKAVAAGKLGNYAYKR